MFIIREFTSRTVLFLILNRDILVSKLTPFDEQRLLTYDPINVVQGQLLLRTNFMFLLEFCSFSKRSVIPYGSGFHFSYSLRSYMGMRLLEYSLPLSLISSPGYIPLLGLSSGRCVIRLWGFMKVEILLLLSLHLLGYIFLSVQILTGSLDFLEFVTRRKFHKGVIITEVHCLFYFTFMKSTFSLK